MVVRWYGGTPAFAHAAAVVIVASSDGAGSRAATSDGVDSASARGRSTFGRRRARTVRLRGEKVNQ